MPNISINKERFVEILDQFKYDIPYEVDNGLILELFPSLNVR